jgi:outer membrane protein
MLKKLFILSALVISGSAFATDMNNGVAVISIEKLNTETKAGKSIIQQLEALDKAFKDKYAKISQEFENKKQELDKQKGVLSKEAFAKKEAEFSAKLAETRKAMLQEENKIKQMQQNAVNEFNTLANDVIQAIVKEGKHLHILAKEGVLYSDPKSDITGQVIAMIDKKADKITLKDTAAK